MRPSCWRRCTGGSANAPAPPPAAGAPSVALLVQVGQQLDRRAPCTLGVLLLMAAWQIHSKHIETSFLARLLDNGAPLSALTDSVFLHSAISFGWTGYYLEKQLGGLRFLLVLASLLVLAQVLRIAMALALAKTLALHSAWRVDVSSVLWATKVVLTRQYPTLAPALGVSVPTSTATWLELLTVHAFLPHAALLDQASGLAAGYVFTAMPGTMARVATCERHLDKTLRRHGIALPVKHRWKLVLRDARERLRKSAWWPLRRRRGVAAA